MTQRHIDTGKVPEKQQARAIRRTVIGATICSLVEWYDVAVYAYLAAVIGVVFFPSGNAAVQLLSSFAVFAVAFLVHPLGGA